MAWARSDIKHGFLSNIHAVVFSSCLFVLNSQNKFTALPKTFLKDIDQIKRDFGADSSDIFMAKHFSNKGFVFETPADSLLSYILVYSHANDPIICIYLTVS